MFKKLLIAALFTPFIIWADCPSCGKPTAWNEYCPSCVRSRDQATMAGIGQMMGGLFTIMAEKDKQEAAEKKALAEEKKKEIAKRNAEIQRNLVILELNDKDEGRHNLGAQLIPVPSTSGIKIYAGQDPFGAYVIADMPPKLYDLPIKFGLDKTQLPGAVDFSILRHSSTASVNGRWTIKNVPFKFFYRKATLLHWNVKLVSEDELLLQIVTEPEQKEILKVTLVNDTPFDFAHEAGVDGRGLNQGAHSYGIGAKPSKKGKKKGLSW